MVCPGITWRSSTLPSRWAVIVPSKANFASLTRICRFRSSITKVRSSCSDSTSSLICWNVVRACLPWILRSSKATLVLVNPCSADTTSLDSGATTARRDNHSRFRSFPEKVFCSSPSRLSSSLSLARVVSRACCAVSIRNASRWFNSIFCFWSCFKFPFSCSSSRSSSGKYSVMRTCCFSTRSPTRTSTSRTWPAALAFKTPALSG